MNTKEILSVISELRAEKYMRQEERDSTNYIDLHEDFAARLEAALRAELSRAEGGFVVVPREPTEAMLDAGRSAVMARDCSGKDWSPRQHYEASGISTEGIPANLLDGYHSIIPKEQGAALVYAAMLSAAPPQATASEGGARAVVIVEEVPGCEPHWYINLPRPKGEPRATAWFEKHEQAVSFCDALNWTHTTEYFES